MDAFFNELLNNCFISFKIYMKEKCISITNVICTPTGTYIYLSKPRTSWVIVNVLPHVLNVPKLL